MMTDVLRQGRYRVERPLGAGAMGTVVLARDTVLDRLVAVKVLASHLAEDEAFPTSCRCSTPAMTDTRSS
jgi:serine/threonine protein kinase